MDQHPGNKTYPVGKDTTLPARISRMEYSSIEFESRAVDLEDFRHETAESELLDS